MFDQLDDVFSDLTNRLVRAARDRKSPMHSPAVISGDVDARIMVLRAFDSSGFTLRFHTDTRAPKAVAFSADPRAAVLFYDKGAKVQIRARGRARVLADAPVTDEAWANGTNFARRCYLGDGPGTPSGTPTSGLPSAFEGVEPSDEKLAEARPNFAVLMIEIASLDWLYLAHTGHVRAAFERDTDGAWQGRWLTP